MLWSQRYLVVAGVALIVMATCAIYAPAMGGGFIFDDDVLLTNNALIKASDGLSRIWFSTAPIDYWPMTNSSFWLEWRLWGSNPIGYHVTNLLLHVAAALLIWAILRKLAIPGAFLAALLFTVHPVNVESVAWIAQRKNTLAMVFFLLSILWYLCDAQRRRETEEGHSQRIRSIGRWYGLSLLAFVLAMLSKGSVAILPPVLLGLAWWQRRRIAWADCARAAPFFLVAVILVCVNMWFQTHGKDIVVRDVSFAERLAGAGTVVWFYLSKAFVPLRLVFVYPQWSIQRTDVLWWLPLLAAMLITAVLWWQRRRSWDRPLFFAWGFFCIALLPVMGFTDSGYMKYSLVADHYQHIALIGVVAIVAAGWSFWHDRTESAIRWVATITAAAAVFTLALLTWNQSRLYGDEILLYRSTLEENPECWMAHFNLANALNAAGHFEEAIGHYEQTLRSKPDNADVFTNLGIALEATEQTQKALECFQQALLLKPESAQAHNNLAWLYAVCPDEHVRDGKLAVKLATRACELSEWKNAATIDTLAAAYAETGDFEQAIQWENKAIEIEPDANNNIYDRGHLRLYQAGKSYRELTTNSRARK